MSGISDIPKRGKRRRMRHVRLLARLVQLGWRVEACYTAYGIPAYGCFGWLDPADMRHRFTMFQCSPKSTATPPFKNAWLRFALVPILPRPFNDSTIVSGWRGLAEFVVNHTPRREGTTS